MRIGIFANFTSPDATPAFIASYAQRMEAAGAESIWLGEHVVLFDEMEFGYPGSKDGRIPMPPGGGMLDPVASFAYMAAHTSRVRFGTGIALVPQRNPVYTAKEFATLDWLTGGRMDFGIGVGWCREEVEACGYGWHDRGRRCDEFLEVIQRLWREEVVVHEGEYLKLSGARLDPKPVQAPLPTLVGGHSDAAFRRTARFGQGWYGFALTPELTAGLLPRLERALSDAGRSRADCEVIVTPHYQVSEDDVRAFADLGVDRLVLQNGGNRPANIDKRVDQVAAYRELAA